MPTYRMQCQFNCDSPFPRDRMLITPHFHDGGLGTDPQSLCSDLVAALDGWAEGSGEIRVKAYDTAGAPPHYPVGEAFVAESTVFTSNAPREVAVCLSFYGERNLPRQRGRVYVPFVLMQSSGSITTARPNVSTRGKVAALAPIFEGLGGPDVDWCVWSRVNSQHYPVTNWYVDNEWDTIRSRGLRPDERTVGTTSEG